ncbi:LutC/YkgG family protein [Rufibacter immobilis]|uniref:LutC/YkgG family protein n=1 Tax=Rufibacter immobilis TaxID=1348778 RepID=UPI0035E4C6C0
MSSRQAILDRIKENKPVAQASVVKPVFQMPLPQDRLALFLHSIGVAGSVGVLVPDLASVGTYLQENFKSHDRVVNTVAGVGFGGEVSAALLEKEALSKIEIAVVSGVLGVAENGAVWVTEEQVPVRVLPFICEHLVLVVRQQDLVGTMQEAYATIQVDATGYGTFIAGPSRTADIEQSLVIGAHGPKRMHVFILQPEI